MKPTQIDLTHSRRNFIGKIIGGGAAISALPLVATKAVAGTPCAACQDSMTDVDILNYALTLERLEYAFYRGGLARFRASDFTFVACQPVASNPSGRRGENDDDDDGGRNNTVLSASQQVYEYLKLIRDHERAHVATLVGVIQSLGGTPVPECRYNFGYRNARGFLRVAQTLENTGVMAYDGAIALICDPDLQTAGATIATVEARHASYLNLVNGDVPFPSAFDTPKTMQEILAMAGQFIISCP